MTQFIVTHLPIWVIMMLLFFAYAIYNIQSGAFIEGSDVRPIGGVSAAILLSLLSIVGAVLFFVAVVIR